MPSMQVERSSHVATALAGKLYVCGGFDGRRVWCTTEYLDLELATWATAAPMHHFRMDHAGATMGGHLYISGGTGGLHRWWHSSIERFKPGARNARGAWEQFEVMKEKRSGHIMVSIMGNFYVCGGVDEGGKIIHSFQRFLTSRREWQDLPAPKYPRSCALAVVRGATMFMCGGVEDNKFVHKSVECFDTRTGTWQDLPPMPVAKCCSVGTCLDGGLYIFGGQGTMIQNFVQSEEIAMNSVARLDLKKKVWEELPPMTSHRFRMAAAAIAM